MTHRNGPRRLSLWPSGCSGRRGVQGQLTHFGRSPPICSKPNLLGLTFGDISLLPGGGAAGVRALCGAFDGGQCALPAPVVRSPKEDRQLPHGQGSKASQAAGMDVHGLFAQDSSRPCHESGAGGIFERRSVSLYL